MSLVQQSRPSFSFPHARSVGDNSIHHGVVAEPRPGISSRWPILTPAHVPAARAGNVSATRSGQRSATRSASSGRCGSTVTYTYPS